MNLKNFTVLGERNSGTDIIKQLILTHFELPYTQEFGSTHFFGFYGYKSMFTDATLFISIVREPVDWIHAFYRNPQYIPAKNHDLSNFLTSPFYSIWTNSIRPNSILTTNSLASQTFESIIHEDRNIITNKTYKNIFELRKVKTEYLTETLPKIVKHCIIIRYEDLIENPQCIIKQIQDQYNLIAKPLDISLNQLKHQRPIIEFTDETIQYIKSNLDLVQENKLRYNVNKT